MSNALNVFLAIALYTHLSTPFAVFPLLIHSSSVCMFLLSISISIPCALSVVYRFSYFVFYFSRDVKIHAAHVPHFTLFNFPSTVFSGVGACLCVSYARIWYVVYTLEIMQIHIQPYGRFYPLLSLMNVEAKSSKRANEASKQSKQKSTHYRPVKGVCLSQCLINFDTYWYALVCLYAIKLLCSVLFLDTHTIQNIHAFAFLRI